MNDIGAQCLLTAERHPGCSPGQVAPAAAVQVSHKALNWPKPVSIFPGRILLLALPQSADWRASLLVDGKTWPGLIPLTLLPIDTTPQGS